MTEGIMMFGAQKLPFANTIVSDICPHVGYHLHSCQDCAFGTTVFSPGSDLSTRTYATGNEHIHVDTSTVIP